MNVAFRPKSIRAKLTRILVVSLALVLALLGLQIATNASDYSAADRTTRIVGVTLSVQDAVHQLQKERGLTNGLLGGGHQFQRQIAPQRAQTDVALAALNRTIAAPANADAGAVEVRSALSQLADLATVRADVDQGRAQASTTFSFYTNAIGVLNGLELGLDQAQDGTLRHGLQTLYALGSAKEFSGQERGLLNGVFSSGHFTTANYTQFAGILGQKQAALSTYDTFATQSERDALDSVLHSPAAVEAAGYEATAVTGADGRPLASVDPVRWWNAMTSMINGMRTVQQAVGADVTARAVTLRDNAEGWLIGIALLSALVVAGMIALVVGAARSVIGPLGVLAREADEVSARRLPETVALMQEAAENVPALPAVTAPKGAASEITLVAKALDRVQNTALTLAGEQSLIRRNTTASLANLGRRNQNLVRRQLALISDLEREELDPDALANMFELDHLATRMRRNAESLLVLVGETSPRPWAEPLPVTDVIRAALSEVEDYRRVVLRRVDRAWVSGSVVTEIAHMLAELLENGLSFSSPDVEVEIYGRSMGDRYVLAVVDYGIGMSPEDLARARARLRDEENFLVAPTRFLGHYVVGRLARRMAVQVDLGESPVTGITARIVLPGDLLASPPERPEGAPEPVVADARPTPRPVNGTKAPARPKPSTHLSSPLRPGGPEPRRGERRPAEPTVTEPTVIEPSVTEPRWPEQDIETDPVPPPRQSSRVPSPAALGPERTRNGLVKRQPRGRTAVPTRSPSPPRPPGAEASAKDRSPGDVSTMLTAFRRGHQRGEVSSAIREEDQDDH